MKAKQKRRIDTEKLIVEGALEIIHKEGIQKLTIDKIATVSQCNKALIYRYFGGMNGLMTHLAQDTAFMPSVEELLADWDAPMKLNAKQRFFKLISKYSLALRKRPATCEIILQGAKEFSPWLKAIEDARRPVATELCQKLDLTRETLGFSPDVAFSFMLGGLITFTSFQEAALRFQPDNTGQSDLWENLDHFFFCIGDVQ